MSEQDTSTTTPTVWDGLAALGADGRVEIQQQPNGAYLVWPKDHPILGRGATPDEAAADAWQMHLDAVLRVHPMDLDGSPEFPNYGGPQS